MPSFKQPKHVLDYLELYQIWRRKQGMPDSQETDFLKSFLLYWDNCHLSPMEWKEWTMDNQKLFTQCGIEKEAQEELQILIRLAETQYKQQNKSISFIQKLRGLKKWIFK